MEINKNLQEVFKDIGIKTKTIEGLIEPIELKIELHKIISLPHWFINTFTNQEIIYNNKIYLVHIKNIENRTTIDIGILTPRKIFERVFTYGIISKTTAEIYPKHFMNDEIIDVIKKSIENDNIIRTS